MPPADRGGGVLSATATRPRALVVVLALGVPLLAGTGLAVWALADSPLESAATAQPLVGEVDSAERRDQTPTSVSLVPARALSVLSQSTGVVTALSISPGQPIVSGDQPVSVDGRPVVAYVSPSPLYRDISEGLTGPDVTTAQELLVATGYLASADGTANGSTTAAIRAFNADHGYGDDTSTLAVGSLLWVPTGSDAPVLVTIDVGQVVAPQTELYTTSSGLPRVEVRAESDAADRDLTVGATVVALPAGETSITAPADVAAITGVLGDETTASATLESQTPRQVGTVPSTAVVAGVDGVACFFVDVDGPGTVVDADAGSFGLVDVDPGLVGTPVLINPRTTRQDLTCGS